MTALIVIGYMAVGWVTHVAISIASGRRSEGEDDNWYALGVVLGWPLCLGLLLPVIIMEQAGRLLDRSSLSVTRKVHQRIEDRRTRAKREAGQLTVTDDAPKGALSMEER